MLAYLASLTGCPILPASIVSEGSARFVVRFESLMPAPEPNEVAIEETHNRLFKIAETRALERPEQWLLWGQFAAACEAISENGQALVPELLARATPA
jgi:lauroyl/myristoyl acyltransferase